MRLKLIATTVMLCGAATAAEVGQTFGIESDPGGKYTIIELGGSGKMRTIVTKREGKSGTSYTKRVFDCETGKARDFGSGDTLEQVRVNGKKQSKPFDLVDGSIAAHVGGAACDGIYRKLK